MDNKDAYAATWAAAGAAIGAIYSSSMKRSRARFAGNMLLGAAVGWLAYKGIRLRMDNQGPSDMNAGKTSNQ